MYDIFDEIEVESQPNGDIFDEISPSKPAGDIFDEIDLSSEINRDAGRLPDFQATTRGGPSLSLPGGAARSVLSEVGGEFQDFFQNLHTPTYNIVEPFTEQEKDALRLEGKGTQRAAGAVESVAHTANFFTSPIGVATLGIGALPRAAQKIIAGLFATQMAASVPEIARELGNELGKPESERDQFKVAELITTGATTAGLATLTGKHALTPTPKALKLAEEIESAEFAPRETEVAPIEQATRFPRQRVTTEPFLQPGVRELADAALQEAQSPIVRPDPAIERLRATMTEIQPPGSFSREQFRYPEVAREATKASTVPLRTAENIRLAQSEAPPIRVREEVSASTPMGDVGKLEQAFFERLAQRDLVDAVEMLRNQPAEVSRKLVDEVNRVGEKPVDLSAAERTIFNELWDKVYQESLGKESPPQPPPDSINRGGPSASQSPEAQSIEAANKARMREEFSADLKRREAEQPPSPVAASPEPKTEAVVEQATASNIPTRVKLSGSPQTYTTVERLTPTEIEISNGEKPIRIKNERTGKEEIVLESELQEVKAKMEGAAPRRTKADLNKALREAGLDPSVFPDATSKKSALARVIGKLEEAQTKLRGSRATLSMGVPKAILDLALETAIITLKAGKTIGEALDAAIKKVRYNAKGINEAEVRSHLENILTREAESKTYPVEGESVKMRQSAERATTSEMIPKPVQERIAEAPESFYRQQSMKRVEDAVSTMTDAELGTVPRDSNIYTAAKLEQANRLFKEGKNDAGYEVFAELEKEGTRLGQLINQFKLLKGSRPENIVQIINGELKSKGKDPLTEPQRKAATDLATKAKDSDVALEKATDAWLKEPTDSNAAGAEKSLIESNEAALNLQRFTLKYQPKSTPSVLKSILQGNLLTPISEVANIFGNLSFLPFRAANRSIAAGLDVVDSFIRQRPREISTRPIKGTIEAVKGVGRGLRQIPDVFMRGSGNVIKGETRAGLHPVQAWINQFSKTPDMPTTGGRLTINDRVNLLLEGTFGVPAETLLRGLGAGDQPFRQAAQARVIANEARLRGIPDSQLSMARKFPELFFDEAAMKRIQDETLYAIFQRESQTLNFVTKWLRGKGDVVDFLAATVAPYKLTPWNIIGETMSYNPVVALARTTYDAGKGNSRSAKLNAGKLFVGSALTAAGWWLYSKGILAPSLDERDEAQKARLLSNEVIPPNHINLSGLKRALAGEDPTFKAGDETVDVMRAGGLAGSIFYMTANIGRDFEKKPDVGGEELWLSILKQSTLEQARFGLNQSFLNGVDGILTAVKDGNTDTYLRQWMNTVASIPLPNSMATLSRATREYKPDFTANTLDQLKNVVKNRLGFAGLDDYLPLKRDFWGEPLRETPEGRNAIFYQFFDISKNKQVTDDPLKLELYRLWRKTGSSEVIPPLPGKSVTVDKQTYLLKADQHSRFAELVGQQRKRIAEAMAVNPEFYKMGDEQKIHYLKRAYDKGSDIGRGLFWKEYGSQLTPKKTKAGFEGLK